MPFPTTRRSIVLALASDDEAERSRAFGTISELYWRPRCAYARLAHARAPIEAEDLTQSFLARVLEKEALASYDPERGTFRTFLRTLFDRHVANEIKAAFRLKRGGGSTEIDVPHSKSPEELFQDEWARSVFTLAVERLRERIAQNDFALFESCDLDDSNKPSYRDLGERFGMNVTTVTNRLAAARRKFRECVLEILREATASDREYRSEVRALLGVEL
jgi:RNA polymerase sigma factor (sigma-70 family)